MIIIKCQDRCFPILFAWFVLLLLGSIYMSLTQQNQLEAILNSAKQGKIVRFFGYFLACHTCDLKCSLSHDR